MPAKPGGPSSIEKERIVTGPDPERFYCPHPGCNRSFAELWRLKVHYRAPPDVRGSGKERGHGTELKWCPKCGKDLKPGKHHVGCSAGKSAPRQAAKRQRQQQMSTTTESEWLSSEHSDSLVEAAVKRQATRRQLAAAQSAEVSQQQKQQRAAAVAAAAAIAAGGAGAAQPAAELQRGDACRLERLRQGGDAELLFTGGAHVTDFGLVVSGVVKREQGAADVTFTASGNPAASRVAGGGSAAAAAPSGAASAVAPPVSAFAAAAATPLPNDADEMEWLRAPSPMLGLHGLLGEESGPDALLRVPSPPPLPPDWEPHQRIGLLFDFDQFDPVKRVAQQRQQAVASGAAGAPAGSGSGGKAVPLMTATSAMLPAEVTNPSDDYIWQILFAGENDVVPKRVTAHLHHHPVDLFDDDPLLDSLLGTELAPVHPSAPGAEPVGLESLDAVLAHLHPTSLEEMLADPVVHSPLRAPAPQAQQGAAGPAAAGSDPLSAPLSTSGDLSPELCGPAAAAAQQHAGEPVQQVPQHVQQPQNGINGGLSHSSQCGSQSLGGKVKPEAPVAQLGLKPQEVEVGGGGDFLSSFL